MDKQPDIRTTIHLPRAKGENSLLLLKSQWVNVLLSCAEAFLNTRYYINITDGQNVLQPIQGDVKTSDLGRIVTFPLINPGVPGVTSGQFRVFAGAGIPSMATLTAAATQMGIAAAFNDTLNPDLYVDTAGQALYFCTGSGTANVGQPGGSTWAKISGGGGGGGSNDRGLWTPAPSSPYMTFDKVILQTGTANGYYISTIDNNVNAPDSGIGWIQLSSTIGLWM